MEHSGRGCHYHAAFAKYAPITYSITQRHPESFSSLILDKMHNAILQLDVCIVGIHHNKIGHFNVCFPIPAEQAETEECITLRKLEFEHLEDPEPEESTLDKEFLKVVSGQQSSILSAPILRS